MHLVILLVECLFYGKNFLIHEQDFSEQIFTHTTAFLIFPVIGILSKHREGVCIFGSLGTQVFSENLRNGSWRRIHFLDRIFFW